MGTACNRTKVFWVVEPFEHCDFVEACKHVVSCDSFRNGFTVGGRNHPTMKVETGNSDHDVSVACEQRRAGSVLGKELLQSRGFFFKHKGRTNSVATCEKTFDSDRAFADEKLVSFELSASWNICEIAVVLKARIIRCVDWCRVDVVHLGSGMA